MPSHWNPGSPVGRWVLVGGGREVFVNCDFFASYVFDGLLHPPPPGRGFLKPEVTQPLGSSQHLFSFPAGPTPPPESSQHLFPGGARDASPVVRKIPGRGPSPNPHPGGGRSKPHGQNLGFQRCQRNFLLQHPPFVFVPPSWLLSMFWLFFQALFLVCFFERNF